MISIWNAHPVCHVQGQGDRGSKTTTGEHPCEWLIWMHRHGFCGTRFEQQGNRYALAFQDYLSIWPEVYALTDKMFHLDIETDAGKDGGKEETWLGSATGSGIACISCSALRIHWAVTILSSVWTKSTITLRFGFPITSEEVSNYWRWLYKNWDKQEHLLSKITYWEETKRSEEVL